MGCQVEPSNAMKPIDKRDLSTIKNATNPTSTKQFFSYLNVAPSFPFDLRNGNILDKEKWNMKVFKVEVIYVTRVPQDRFDEEVYNNKSKTYYATIENPQMNFVRNM